LKADIEKGAEKNPWSLCSCMRDRERENGGFLRLIGEDQVFKNLDFVVSVYEMKRYINVFSYNSVK
jgi:hypothetical protein